MFEKVVQPAAVKDENVVVDKQDNCRDDKENVEWSRDVSQTKFVRLDGIYDSFRRMVRWR